MRNTEQHDRLDSVARHLLDLSRQRLFGNAEDARHRGNWLPLIKAFFDKNRVDQIVCAHHGLADEIPQRRRAAKTAKPRDRKGRRFHFWYPNSDRAVTVGRAVALSVT